MRRYQTARFIAGDQPRARRAGGAGFRHPARHAEGDASAKAPAVKHNTRASSIVGVQHRQSAR